MNPSIQKLSLVFLLAAVVVSSFAFGAATFLSSRAGDKQASVLHPTQATPSPAASGFQEGTGAGVNGQNLTDTVTDLFAQKLVGANPQGPLSQQDGNVGIMFPTSTQDISVYLSQSLATANVTITPIDNSKVQVVPVANKSDITGYLSTVAQISATLSSNPVWQQSLTASSSPSEQQALVDDSIVAVGNARDSLYKTKVPAPFIILHRSLLAYVNTLGSYLDAVRNDPVAGLALGSQLESRLTERSNDINNAEQDLQKKLPTLLAEKTAPGSQSRLAGLFNIPVAYAQTGVPISDIISWKSLAVMIGHWIADHWQGIVLGQLKNALLQRLSKQVIAWAQGNGVPVYVVNWLIYEADAVASAKSGLVRAETAKLCGNAATAGAYGSLIASALDVPAPPDNNGSRGTVGDGPNCPPVNGTASFYANQGQFNWDGYLNGLKYNAWNDLLTTDYNARVAVAAASKSAVNEALSGRGYTDSKKYVCTTDGSAPTLDADGNRYCADGSIATAQSVTPGSTAQDIVSKSLTSGFDLITAANNQDLYTSLANALASFVINKALDSSGLFDSNTSNGGTGGGTQTPAGNFTDLLSQYSSALRQAYADESDAIDSLDSTITILNTNVPTICSEHGDVISQAADLAQGYSDSETPMKARQTHINDLISGLANAKTIADLTKLASFTEITALETQAAGDKKNSEDALTNANGIVQTCNTSG